MGVGLRWLEARPDAPFSRPLFALTIARGEAELAFRVAMSAGDPARAFPSCSGEELSQVRRQLPDRAVIAFLVAGCLAPGAPEKAIALVLREVEAQHLSTVAVSLAVPLLRDGHLPALHHLADHLRDTHLPLAVALDVAAAKDPSLLSRYAPEVRVGAREVLTGLWPAYAEEPRPLRKPRKR